MDGALALSFALHGFAGNDPCTLVAADRMVWRRRICWGLSLHGSEFMRVGDLAGS
jgi:hypothetical protein